MTWKLEPDALAALRDQLLERGQALEKRGAVEPLEFDSHDGNTRQAEVLLRRVAPFLELLHLMMIADGECGSDERQLLCGVARTLIGAPLPAACLESLLTAFDAHVADEGVEGRVESVAVTLTADRLDAEAAFTLTATMALADGQVGSHEFAVLRHLSEVLGIPAARAGELVEHCPVKARTPHAP